MLLVGRGGWSTGRRVLAHSCPRSMGRQFICMGSHSGQWACTAGHAGSRARLARSGRSKTGPPLRVAAAAAAAAAGVVAETAGPGPGRLWHVRGGRVAWAARYASLRGAGAAGSPEGHNELPGECGGRGGVRMPCPAGVHVPPSRRLPCLGRAQMGELTERHFLPTLRVLGTAGYWSLRGA